MTIQQLQPARACELGLYGDFLFSEATQGGNHSHIASILGPVAGLTEDVLHLTLANFVQFMQGKETHIGAEFVRDAKSLTPGANLWFAKAALDHLVWNQAAEYLSPGYLSTIRSRARREFGQDFFWELQDLAPSRAPDLSRVAEK